MRNLLSVLSCSLRVTGSTRGCKGASIIGLIEANREPATMETMIKPSEYPHSALCPKTETGVSNFLAKNPTYDGRGVVIAIFDSGVDPGAPGLRETTTGLKKVIERYDCGGAGDVDTSTVVTVSPDGTIKGATGRTIQVPASWECPSGEFHVGAKPLFDLYPVKVKERIEAHRRERHWDPAFRSSLSAASRRHHAEAKDNKTPENIDEKYAKDDIEAQVEMLSTFDKKYKDPGPILDCVVFHDGSMWKACLIADPNDLSSAVVLGEFSKTQDFQALSKQDQVSVSINVWDNGNRLEIVGMCGSHGTHVASIAAGYFPENPELNGVAPGAQIASFSIGDGRLNTMETGSALVRAMAHIMQNPGKYHVINMSYGEHAHWSGHGRLGELMKEVVDKYGVTWVASAGNHGPALSTVGTPPWVQANTIIGVGAYVSPDMMAAEYSLREKLPGTPYTWSSRGPTLDGDLGVSVCAPGGAITSVPGFTLRNAQLMNGTSMAAPHVAGCVALMLSGAMDKKVGWSPYSVKKSLQNSALYLSNKETYAQGYGLVKVEEAFSLLESYSAAGDRDVRFSISVTSPGSTTGWPMKGIYIRDPPLNKAKEYTVSVDPVFFQEDTVDPEKKINFRMSLCLASNDPWVHVPKYFDLANLERSFNVRVDAEGLPPGFHYSRVEAFDAQNPSAGPVFAVHITVIQPMSVGVGPFFRPCLDLPNILYAPGDVRRYFVQVPRGTSWATLNLRLNSASSNCRFVVHAMSLIQGHSCTTEETYKMVSLQPMEETTVAFSVSENLVLELVIARWWAEPNEPATLSSILSFRSLTLNKQEIVMSAGDAYSKVIVRNSFSTEEMQPSAILKHQVQLLRPSDVKLNALTDPRDMIPNNRTIYELLSTYNFNLSRATEVTVNCSLLSDTLYECEYESQLWMIFDSNKRYIASGDAYPTKWSTKLEKGEYILRLSVRHEKREALERFLGSGANNDNSGGVPSWTGDTLIPTLPVLLMMKLPSNITLDCYSSLYDVQDFKPSKKSSNTAAIMKKECSTNVFISTFIPEKSIKSLPGSSTLYLQGTFTVSKEELGKKVCTVPLKLCVPEAPPKVKSSAQKDSDKSKVEEMEEQLRDVTISWMSKLPPEDAKRVYEELAAKYGSHLPVHIARLNYLDNLPSASGSTTPAAAGAAQSNASIASARSGVAEATASLTSARSGVAEATASLTSARSGVAEATASLTSARSGVADATASLTSARSGVADATASLTSARSGMADATASLTSARSGVAEATESLISTRSGVADATASFTSARSELSETSPSTTSARSGLVETSPSVTSARSGVADTSASFTSARSGGEGCTRPGCVETNGSVTSANAGGGGESREESQVKSKETLQEIIATSDKILGMVDIPALLMYYGTKASASSNLTDAQKTKQAMDKQKNAVVEAYVKKGLALAELAKIETPQKPLAEQLQEILLEVNKLVEVTDSRVLELSVQHAMAKGHYGRAVRFLYKQLESDPSKWSAESDKKMIDLFQKLGWSMSVWNWETVSAHRYPKDFRPF